jgi:hypothetical protein
VIGTSSFDSIECPDCGTRILLRNTGNIYCDNCGLDVYFHLPPRDNSDWENLPWDTFQAGISPLADEEDE